MHMCIGVHAATETNTDTLKIYLGQRTGAHYGRDDASLRFCVVQLIIIDTRASTRK